MRNIGVFSEKLEDSQEYIIKNILSCSDMILKTIKKIPHCVLYTCYDKEDVNLYALSESSPIKAMNFDVIYIDVRLMGSKVEEGIFPLISSHSSICYFKGG